MDHRVVADALQRKLRERGGPISGKMAALRLEVENQQYRGLAVETKEQEKAERRRALWTLLWDLMQLERQQFQAATTTTRSGQELGTITVAYRRDLVERTRRLLRTTIQNDPKAEGLRRQCAAAAPFVLGDFYSLVGGVALIRRSAALFTEEELNENDTLRLEFAQGPSVYTTEGVPFRRALDKLLNPLVNTNTVSS